MGSTSTTNTNTASNQASNSSTNFATQAAQQTASNTAGTYGQNTVSGPSQAAMDIINQNYGPISQSAIQGYMSPYTNQVINSTMGQLQNQYGQQQSALTGNAISQGALGGDRSKLAMAALMGVQGLNTSSTISGLENTAYSQALTAAQADRTAALQAAGMMGTQSSVAGMSSQATSGITQAQTQGTQNTAMAGASTGASSSATATSMSPLTMGLAGLALLKDGGAARQGYDAGGSILPNGGIPAGFGSLTPMQVTPYNPQQPQAQGQQMGLQQLMKMSTQAKTNLSKLTGLDSTGADATATVDASGASGASGAAGADGAAAAGDGGAGLAAAGKGSGGAVRGFAGGGGTAQASMPSIPTASVSAPELQASMPNIPMASVQAPTLPAFPTMPALNVAMPTVQMPVVPQASVPQASAGKGSGGAVRGFADGGDTDAPQAENWDSLMASLNGAPPPPPSAGDESAGLSMAPLPAPPKDSGSVGAGSPQPEGWNSLAGSFNGLQSTLTPAPQADPYEAAQYAGAPAVPFAAPSGDLSALAGVGGTGLTGAGVTGNAPQQPISMPIGPDQAAQAPVEPPVAPPSAPAPQADTWGGIPHSDALAENRKRFAAELDDPKNRALFKGIMAGENNNPTAATAVLESAMNRAAANGTTLAFEMRRTVDKGYYAGYNPAALNNPKTNAALEQGIDMAMRGSNVSNFATDNSSGAWGRARNASGMYTQTAAHNGELFSYPSRSDARGYDKYWDWRQSVGGGTQDKPSDVHMAASDATAAFRRGTGINLATGPDPVTGGADAAARGLGALGESAQSGLGGLAEGFKNIISRGFGGSPDGAQHPFQGPQDKAAGGLLSRIFGVNFNPLNLSSRDRMTMLAVVGGMSQPGGNLGTGLMAGVNYQNAAGQQDRQATLDAMKLQGEFAKLSRPQIIGSHIETDPATGFQRTVHDYGTYDAATRTYKPYTPAPAGAAATTQGATPPAAPPQQGAAEAPGTMTLASGEVVSIPAALEGKVDLSKPVDRQAVAILAGRENLPAVTRGNPLAQSVQNRVRELDPTYNANRFNYLKGWQNGNSKIGQNRISFNAAIEHGEGVWALNQAHGYTSDVGPANRASTSTQEWWDRQKNAPWLNDYNAARKEFAQEAAKLGAGSTGSALTDREEIYDTLDPSKGKDAVDAAVKRWVTIMDGKGRALGSDFRQNMGPYSGTPPVLDEENIARHDRIMGKGASNNAPPANAAPQVGEVRKGYRFTGGNPASQSSWQVAQ